MGRGQTTAQEPFGPTPTPREVDEALQPSGTVEVHEMGSVSSCFSCLVPEGWSPWPCCHPLGHHVVGQNLGQVRGSSSAGGWVLPSREAPGQGWDEESGWDQGTGWDTPLYTQGWGSDPLHPQLSGGGLHPGVLVRFGASWCILGRLSSLSPLPQGCAAAARCSATRSATCWGSCRTRRASLS